MLHHGLNASDFTLLQSAERVTRGTTPGPTGPRPIVGILYRAVMAGPANAQALLECEDLLSVVDQLARESRSLLDAGDAEGGMVLWQLHLLVDQWRIAQGRR
jgi:hypothetical protein